MKMIEGLLKEMEQEANTTRKMLERVPVEKFSWQPHPRSMTLGQLSGHVAEINSWIPMVLDTEELDFAQSPYQPPSIGSNAELLAFFEKNLAAARERLGRATEEELNNSWTLRSGENIFSRDPKTEVLRMCFCQIVHHRAQLGVYLRLLDIPIPGSYGPSADEPSF